MKLRITAGSLGCSACCCAALIFGPLVAGVGAATTNGSPDFKEVYDLLRAHLAGGDEAELNHAAVQGMISQLQPRVALVGDTKNPTQSTNADSAMRTAVFDGAYGYLRIGQMGSGTDKQVLEAYEKLSASNQLKGVVIDLRFAGGQDYAAATGLADMFFSKEKPLLDYGDGMKSSTGKTNVFSVPLTILVNKQTTGAAEAFAGILRQADIGLLLGTNTAGKATMGEEFSLKTGQRLWIATSLVKLGNGKLFPAAGLKPDIQVDVSPADEQAYFEDAYKILPRASHLANATTNQTNLSLTNRPARHRPTEAELVRMHRDGETPDFDAPPQRLREGESPAAKSSESELPPHVIYDPALARAIDLLKGLSVVQQFRSS